MSRCLPATWSLVVAAAACVGRPPFVILTVEDPAGRAAGFATIAVGSEPTAMAVVAPNLSALPLSLTVTAPDVGDKDLWVEARDGGGGVLGRGSVIARFATAGTPTAVVTLSAPCDAHSDCDDGRDCTGIELCADRICVVGVSICGANFPCVVASSCREGEETPCDYEVDHRLCDQGERCDPSLGCIPGVGCDRDEDCDDGQACNGREICVRGNCEPGFAPCTSSLSCVRSSCAELEPNAHVCSLNVDHASCGDGEYCHPAVGCVAGHGCYDDTDCDDHLVCNGVERCVNLVCVGGSPPSLADDDLCTLDGCDDARVAFGGASVFHYAVPGLDGGGCVLAAGGAGVCVSAKGGCAVSECGDHVVAANEECDDGNNNDEDDCRNDCHLAFCGDGAVRAGLELCDDAGESAICDRDCTPARCGDRAVNPTAGEECDTGEESAGCTAGCRLSHCGDGVTNPIAGEVCDDGNAASGDGCRSDCMKVEVCGDGIVDAGELCDDVNDNPNDGCDACTRTTWTDRLLVGRGEGQGVPTSIAIYHPSGIAVDRHNNVFIVDGSRQLIWRVDGATGLTTVAAGRAERGYAGDGGPATDALLDSAIDVAVDGSGNLYISDSANCRIRKVCGDSAACEVGTITTVAGTGQCVFWIDHELATQAPLYYPQGIAIDGLGNLVIAELGRNRVRRIEAATGRITTVAGGDGSGDGGDGGPATSAQMKRPVDVAITSDGDLIIADEDSARVRHVDATTGIITTVAGTGVAGYSGDGGPATSAQLYRPRGVAVDGAGNLLIADTYNLRIRRIDAVTGIITTVAGSSGQGFFGDGGPATNATLYRPSRIAVDQLGQLLIADSVNHRIRRVANGAGGYVDGTITTFAGSGATAYIAEGGLATTVGVSTCYGIAVDAFGNLFFTDSSRFRVRRRCGDAASCSVGTVTTVAGTDVQGFFGDGGPATSAWLNDPQGLVVDGAGNVFFSDTRVNRIRRVDAVTGIVATVVGVGWAGFAGDGGPAAAAAISWPTGLALDPDGNLLIVDRNNSRIRRVDATTGIITTVAGNGVAAFGGDGELATNAALFYPRAIALDLDGNLFIADTFNNRIRRVDGVTGVISTIAGTGVAGSVGDGGPAVEAELKEPGHVAVDAVDNVFIADTANYRIRRIDAVTGHISTVAGTGEWRWPTDRGDGGPATNATFGAITSLAFDSAGNLLVGGGSVRRLCLNPTVCVAGTMSTLVGAVDALGDGLFPTSRLAMPRTLVEVDSRWLVTDGPSGRVRAVDLGATTVASVVGYPNGFTDDAVAARFSRLLLDPRGSALDVVGSRLFVTEHAGHTIRSIDVAGTPATWTVSTWAGALGTPGSADGARLASRFNGPSGLLFDPARRRLYVADAGNHTIRAVDVDGGQVTTVAGTTDISGFYGEEVPAATARFCAPTALAMGNDGSLYVADTGNSRVRRIDAAGLIKTVLGDGTPASSGEGAPAAHFAVDRPAGLAVDSFGNLFVTSSSTVKIVSAGNDGVATGDDEVRTIYGRPPRDAFPESVTRCLAGLNVIAGADGAVDGRLLVLDACVGFLLQLDRTGP